MKGAICLSCVFQSLHLSFHPFPLKKLNWCGEEILVVGNKDSLIVAPWKFDVLKLAYLPLKHLFWETLYCLNSIRPLSQSAYNICIDVKELQIQSCPGTFLQHLSSSERKLNYT